MVSVSISLQAPCGVIRGLSNAIGIAYTWKGNQYFDLKIVSSIPEGVGFVGRIRAHNMDTRG